MRIAYVSNWNTHCGVAEFAHQHVRALEARGHVVLKLDGTKSFEAPLGYDVVHVNFHGGLVPHLRKAHLGDAPLSIFLHEPYGSGNRANTPLWDSADLLVAAAPCEPEVEVIEFPCIEPPPGLHPYPCSLCDEEPSLGYAGLREDGAAALHTLCAKRGWLFNRVSHGYGGRWLSTEEVVRGLSYSTLNVFWYGAAYGGQSLGVMNAIASGRPLLLSRSRLFSTLFPYEGEQVYFADDLEKGVDQVLADLRAGKALTPGALAHERAWPRMVKKWEALWQTLLRRQGDSSPNEVVSPQ